MTRLFVTHIVPKQQILQYGLSVAACNFSYNLIGSGAFDGVFSILPTFIGGKIPPFDGLIYSGWRKNKWLRRIAWIPENISLFRKIPKGSSVWYYNCTTLNMLLITLLRLFKPSVRQHLIVLDYTPSSSKLARLQLFLSNRMDGTIQLANSPLFTVKNTCCLPGVVPEDENTWPEITAIKPEFLISGALGDNIAMLPTLLDVFADTPQLTLHITGRAPDAAMIQRYTNQYPNIIYHGMVDYDEYLRILHNTPFLLSTRNPLALENQCNFPSKIIEALLHNRIVLSTIDYPQIDGIKYLKINSDSNLMRQDILRISGLPEDELLNFANQAVLVKERFNSHVWADCMENIERNSTRHETH